MACPIIRNDNNDSKCLFIKGSDQEFDSSDLDEFISRDSDEEWPVEDEEGRKTIGTAPTHCRTLTFPPHMITLGLQVNYEIPPLFEMFLAQKR